MQFSSEYSFNCFLTHPNSSQILKAFMIDICVIKLNAFWVEKECFDEMWSKLNAISSEYSFNCFFTHLNDSKILKSFLIRYANCI